MYTFEYLFYPDKSKIQTHEFCDNYISAFLSSLCKNGQIIDQHWNIIVENDVVRFICLAMDDDSLSSKYYNSYCDKYFLDLRALSLQDPEYRQIGKTEGMSDCCKCQESSYFILFTTSIADYPPITCGDCNLAVPLYKFPKINNEKEYNTLLGWEREYQACDSLFMLTSFGERYGYRQISNIKSKLSMSGLEICKKLSMTAGKPFYYFLHKWYSPQKDSCPLCGSYWKLGGNLHNLYTHKCEECFIISDNPEK